MTIKPLSHSKVPEVTLMFWAIKIAATTLGETAGDAVSMSLKLGFLISTLIFALACLIAVGLQVQAKKFYPFLYWFTIITTTTVGTTLADFATRSLGIGYAGGSILLLLLLLGAFYAWSRVGGRIGINTDTPRSEICYWITITFSQTLGTALGDWTVDSAGFGYLGSACIFSLIIAGIALAYYKTKLSRTLLFWCGFVFTRPLGAVVGDWLDKPIANGGLELDRFAASIALLVFMGACLLVRPQKAASGGH